MPASAARVEANRQNALLSTGPRTLEGKNQSRANALKHGFTASLLRTPEEQAAISDNPEPDNLDPTWLVRQIALIAGRIERLAVAEQRTRDEGSIRAETCWDDDQKREAETLALKLSIRPSETVRLLEATPQGCGWLMERWAMLARAFQRDGSWDEACRSLAFDLMGTPPEFRMMVVGETINYQGEVVNPGTDPVAFAQARVAHLATIRDRMAPINEFQAETAQMGLGAGLDLDSRRLRSYEQALHRRLQWCVKQLSESSQAKLQPIAVEPPPELPERNEPNEEPEPEVETEVKPPTRHDRKALRAERRRAASDRKLNRRLESQTPRASEAQSVLCIGS